MDEPVEEEGPLTSGRSLGAKIDGFKHEYNKFM